MFTFHKRGRSLISVKDMDKAEKLLSHVRVLEEVEDEDENDDTGNEPRSPRHIRNLTMIYLLFLAEAIMAASLTSQVSLLVPSPDSGCSGTDTSFLRSTLECAYFFGSATGIFWGSAVDRYGRRRVALLGLSGMVPCCLSMGFFRSFTAFAVLRFVAGVVGSATRMAGLAMSADVTHESKSRRTTTIARLPLVAACGCIGPLVSHMWSRAIDGRIFKIFARYPGLSGQIACATLIFSITLAETMLLEEVSKGRVCGGGLRIANDANLQTLPTNASHSSVSDESSDSEKAGFLTTSHHPSAPRDSLNITNVEALTDSAATPKILRPVITTIQMLTAPTLLLLLSSYSLLLLHTSIFDLLLPHITRSTVRYPGTSAGIPCSYLRPLTLFLTLLAAIRILRLIPWVTSRVGTLFMYRRVTLVFPLFYTLVPLLGLGISIAGPPQWLAGGLSALVMLAVKILAGSAEVLALLLVLAAVPDAASTGTVLGVMALAELFRALAVGVSGSAFYLFSFWAEDIRCAMVVLSAVLWVGLVVMAGVGWLITGRLREEGKLVLRVGKDVPESCLVWEGVWDCDSEGEGECEVGTGEGCE